MVGFAPVIELSSLNGSNGFQINGEAAGDQSGVSVSSAGDVNGDGIDDLLIGAPNASPHGEGSGASYVVFGKDAGFAANLGLATVNGTNGFQISGETADDNSGVSVSSAGDVNGDGFDDLIIGTYGASPNGVHSGASYVVFGHTGSFAASLNLSTLNGTNGFQISGEEGDYSGRSVASAGDVNGDGFDDLIVGAPTDRQNGIFGASYVVFGHAGSFTTNLFLSTLNGGNGFRIGAEAGAQIGHSVASAGDVNGDGIDDLIMGAPSAGASYVMFGHSGGFAASLNLATLDGTNGFKISGASPYDQFGISVASAGDVNGDGIDDLIVGAPWANSNGLLSGASYVVFGKSGGFTANLNLSTLNGTNGFRISGHGSETSTPWRKFERIYRVRGFPA